MLTKVLTDKAVSLIKMPFVSIEMPGGETIQEPALNNGAIPAVAAAANEAVRAPFVPGIVVHAVGDASVSRNLFASPSRSRLGTGWGGVET
jgi:hypothetical protein